MDIDFLLKFLRDNIFDCESSHELDNAIQSFATTGLSNEQLETLVYASFASIRARVLFGSVIPAVWEKYTALVRLLSNFYSFSM